MLEKRCTASAIDRSPNSAPRSPRHTHNSSAISAICRASSTAGCRSSLAMRYALSKVSAILAHLGRIPDVRDGIAHERQVPRLLKNRAIFVAQFFLPIVRGRKRDALCAPIIRRHVMTLARTLSAPIASRASLILASFKTISALDTRRGLKEIEMRHGQGSQADRMTRHTRVRCADRAQAHAFGNSPSRHLLPCRSSTNGGVGFSADKKRSQLIEPVLKLRQRQMRGVQAKGRCSGVEHACQIARRIAAGTEGGNDVVVHSGAKCNTARH